MVGHLPTGFRILWLFFTLCAWLWVLPFALHRSKHPDVFGRYSWAYFLSLCLFLGIAIFITTANLERLLMRIYAARYSILLCLVATLLSLAAVEAYLRLADPLGISYYEESARYNLDAKVADPELIFRHRRSWQTTSRRGDEIRFNEFGLRDEQIQPKQESEYRILALGDSVTFGAGVDQSEVFTIKLQRILTTRLGRTVRVSVRGCRSAPEKKLVVSIDTSCLQPLEASPILWADET
jgi:hypothetical protein